MFFGTIIKDEHVDPMVESNMEGGISILVQ
jgi:hypothetical protein